MSDAADKLIKRDEFEPIALLLNMKKHIYVEGPYYFIGSYIIYQVGTVNFLYVLHSKGGETKLLTQEILEEVLLNEEHINSGKIHPLFEDTLTL